MVSKKKESTKKPEKEATTSVSSIQGQNLAFKFSFWFAIIIFVAALSVSIYYVAASSRLTTTEIGLIAGSVILALISIGVLSYIYYEKSKAGDDPESFYNSNTFKTFYSMSLLGGVVAASILTVYVAQQSGSYCDLLGGSFGACDPLPAPKGAVSSQDFEKDPAEYL